MEEPHLTRGGRTQRDILDAAKVLFLTQGYTATSMRQIARAVGITPSAIYNHFASKGEIFTSVLRAVAPFGLLSALFDGNHADTPEALVDQGLRGLMDTLIGHEDYLRLALIDAQERDGATLVGFMPQFFERAMGFYQRLVALDAAHGRLRPIPPFLFLQTLVSLILGYLITERVVRPEQTFGLPHIDWVQGLTDVFLHGVLNPPELERR